MQANDGLESHAVKRLILVEEGSIYNRLTVYMTEVSEWLEWVQAVRVIVASPQPSHANLLIENPRDAGAAGAGFGPLGVPDLLCKRLHPSERLSTGPSLHTTRDRKPRTKTTRRTNARSSIYRGHHAHDLAQQNPL